MNSNKSALVFCLVGLSSLVNLPSLAFGISPIKVYFEKGSSSRDVTLDNAEDKTVRLKVQAYKWTEDGDGKRQLTPTQEIAVFPAILELKSKSKRIIRLASKLPPKQIEQSYRLTIEQLPEAVVKKPEATPDGAKPTTATAQLNFLYTLNLPVFINPINIDRKSSLTSPSVNGGNLSRDTNATISTLGLSGGIISGASTLTVLGAMTWSGGVVETGDLFCNGGLSITGSTRLYGSSANTENTGTPYLLKKQ